MILSGEIKMDNNLQSLTEEEMINTDGGKRDWVKITAAGLIITGSVLSGGSAVIIGLGITSGISAIIDEI